MSDEQPAPPSELSNDIVDMFDEYSPERLHTVSQYAEHLAEYKERETRLDDSAGDDGPVGDDNPASDDDSARHDATGDQFEDRPDGVPTKATITVKEINENRYYYWQWRDGDRIKSKYKGPVNPDE